MVQGCACVGVLTLVQFTNGSAACELQKAHQAPNFTRLILIAIFGTVGCLVPILLALVYLRRRHELSPKAKGPPGELSASW